MTSKTPSPHTTAGRSRTTPAATRPPIGYLRATLTTTRTVRASSAPAAPPKPPAAPTAAELAELRRPVTREDIWRIEWRTQPKLREEFSSAESYVAYQRAVVAGAIMPPDDGR